MAKNCSILSSLAGLLGGCVVLGLTVSILSSNAPLKSQKKLIDYAILTLCAGSCFLLVGKMISKITCERIFDKKASITPPVKRTMEEPKTTTEKSKKRTISQKNLTTNITKRKSKYFQLAGNILGMLSGSAVFMSGLVVRANELSGNADNENKTTMALSGAAFPLGIALIALGSILGHIMQKRVDKRLKNPDFEKSYLTILNEKAERTSKEYGAITTPSVSSISYSRSMALDSSKIPKVTIELHKMPKATLQEITLN